jgi:hypothetical protein
LSVLDPLDHHHATRRVYGLAHSRGRSPDVLKVAVARCDAKGGDQQEDECPARAQKQ